MTDTLGAYESLVAADGVRWQVQLGALAAVVVFAVVMPRWGAALHARVTAGLAWLGRRPSLWVALCGLLAGLGSAMTAVFILWPEPNVHDEFSYLLAAETFASGSVAKPTHPLWEHFEAFHILQQPSYASKYPPAQGLVLALGIALSGDAALGLWLSSAAMCAAIAWMLLGWLPRRWAVLGSIAVLLHWGPGSYWAQTFWGGNVAAASGALVFGALPRILQQPRVRHAVILGIGLAGLANSRPYEGVIASLPVACMLVVWMVRNRRRADLQYVRRLVLPLSGVLLVTAVLMAYYNWRVTGDPLVLPYALYDRQYAIYPSFLWQPLHAVPDYRHDVLQRYFTGFQAGDYGVRGDLLGWAWMACLRIRQLSWFYFGVLLLVPLLALPAVGFRRPVALAATTCALVLAGLFATTYSSPHYAAPLTGPLMLLVGAGWRELARLRLIGKRRAQALSVCLLLGLVGVTIVRLVDYPAASVGWERLRAGCRHVLLQRPGRDLVLVSHTENSWVHAAWVYNRADIDRAEVVWARDMGEEKNKRLLHHFRDRFVWKLKVGALDEALEAELIVAPQGRRGQKGR